MTIDNFHFSSLFLVLGGSLAWVVHSLITNSFSVHDNSLLQDIFWSKFVCLDKVTGQDAVRRRGGGAPGAGAPP